jgi:hypothetical protein
MLAAAISYTPFLVIMWLNPFIMRRALMGVSLSCSREKKKNTCHDLQYEVVDYMLNQTCCKLPTIHET